MTTLNAVLHKSWAPWVAWWLDAAILVALFALGWHYAVLALALVFAGLHVIGSTVGIRQFFRG